MDLKGLHLNLSLRVSSFYRFLWEIEKGLQSLIKEGLKSSIKRKVVYLLNSVVILMDLPYFLLSVSLSNFGVDIDGL